MAFQEATPTDIVPQKSLNDIDSMYYHLCHRLNTTQQITDLIPFISKLMNIDALKQHLKSSLDKEYQTAKSKDKDHSIQLSSETNIRSLFISLFSFNGIPSDSIHAHILSFLPAVEYRKMPFLSKQFRHILRNNPFLYNDKNYQLQLCFSINADEYRFRRSLK